MEKAKESMHEKISVKTIVLLAIFIAIEIIFCFTPLGSLPLGPGIVATLAHIPAIIAALILGKKSGLFMGFVMGLCSQIWWSTIGIAMPTAFAFTPFAQYGNAMSLVICFIPRILMPFIAVCLYDLMKNKIKSVPAAAISSCIATFLNSAMVLTLIYISFVKNSDVSANLGGNYVKFIIAWGGLNAIMEIIIAGVVSGALIVPINKVKQAMK